MTQQAPRHTREFWRVASRRSLIALVVTVIIAVGTSAVSLNISTSRGRLYILWSMVSVEYADVPNLKPAVGASFVPPSVRWSFNFGESGGVRSLGIPLWSPAAALGLTYAACEYRRRTAVDEGACAQCGYDLRGIGPDPGGQIVCPECARRA